MQRNLTMLANQRRREKSRLKTDRKRVRNATGNPESQSVPLDPDYWEELGWMGVRSDSGVRMNHQQAIGHPPLWRGINLICRGVSKLPCNVLQVDGDNWTVDKKHPGQRLLKKPNPSMRYLTWLQTMLYHAILRGNGYSAIVRRGPNPIQLILLDPKKTEPFWANGDLWYKTEAGSEKRKIPAADMFHLKGLGFDGLVGHDILSIMANALGMGPAARKWMSKLLSRGSTAGGLLQLPRELSPEARRKRQEEFDKYQSGLDNAFKTLALEDGAKWIRTMVTPQEAAVFQALSFDQKTVANVIGVPPHKLGDDSKAAYNSLEQENKSYLDDSLDPWCVEFESEACDKLLTEEQKDSESHKVVLDRTELELGDNASQAEYCDKLVNGGLMLPDEGRKVLSLPALPNGEGKKLRVPVNISVDGQIAGRAATDPAKPQVPDQAAGIDAATVRNAARGLVLDRLQRLDKIAQETRLKNKGGDDFNRNHRDRIRDALAPILPILAAADQLPEWWRSADELAADVLVRVSLEEQIDLVMERKP